MTDSQTPTPAPSVAPTAVDSVRGIKLPGLKVPSGTLLNDLVALATAVVAILKAFGVF